MNHHPTDPLAGKLELLAAAHVVAFLVGVTWAFGGNADWVRTPLSIWGSLGIAMTLLVWAVPRLRALAVPSTFHWTLPVLALNIVVGLSVLTPGLHTVTFGDSNFIAPTVVPWWKPSAAVPSAALRSLWLFDGIYFSCLNVALTVRRRRVLRYMLAILLVNAVVLAIFGTVQKLSGATGLYFGRFASPQIHFFASFVYDNHWGAFAVLMSALAVGLTLRYARGERSGGFFRGPAFMGIVALGLLGLSVPLSGSRACSLLTAILLCFAFARGALTISGAIRQAGVPPATTYVGMGAALLLALVGIWFVAGDVINERVLKTKEQFAAMVAQGGIGSRSVLYHDTWAMARDRVGFGWGMGSFPTVFRLYNSQVSRHDRLPIVYHDAHSDWIQSVAETGLVGTVLIALAVLLPMRTWGKRMVSPVPFFLLVGCGLVVAYAWVEFPFGNVAVVLAWWLCLIVAVHYHRLRGAQSNPRS